LDKVAKDIVKFKPRKVIVSGHTDSVGSYDSNMLLAQQRGEVAANYLINRHKINARLIDVKVYGENKPRIESTPTEKDMRNRYVKIQFEFDNRFYPE
jgi:outer membrane protein OmpA-like peptidoglycan-associated protein